MSAPPVAQERATVTESVWVPPFGFAVGVATVWVVGPSGLSSQAKTMNSEQREDVPSERDCLIFFFDHYSLFFDHGFSFCKIIPKKLVLQQGVVKRKKRNVRGNYCLHFSKQVVYL
jgi:hypothetical protein